MRRQLASSAPALLLAAAMTACGGNGGGTGNPASPTPPAAPVETTTITITPAGVSPQHIAVPVGARVTFVNSNTRNHEMSSDPHPNHTDCPALNIGPLSPNQSRQTGELTVVRVCGFHDHLQDTNASLRGTITVR
jgi:plastocyanin